MGTPSPHLEVVRSIAADSEMLAVNTDIRNSLIDPAHSERGVFHVYTDEFPTHVLGAAAVAALSPFRIKYEADGEPILIRTGIIEASDIAHMPYVGGDGRNGFRLEATIGPNREDPERPNLVIRKASRYGRPAVGGGVVLSTLGPEDGPSSFTIPMVSDGTWYGRENARSGRLVAGIEAANRLASFVDWEAVIFPTPQWPPLNSDSWVLSENRSLLLAQEGARSATSAEPLGPNKNSELDIQVAALRHTINSTPPGEGPVSWTAYAVSTAVDLVHLKLAQLPSAELVTLVDALIADLAPPQTIRDGVDSEDTRTRQETDTYRFLVNVREGLESDHDRLHYRYLDGKNI